MCHIQGDTCTACVWCIQGDNAKLRVSVETDGRAFDVFDVVTAESLRTTIVFLRVNNVTFINHVNTFTFNVSHDVSQLIALVIELTLLSWWY